MSPAELLDRIDQLGVWKSDDQRAPHKPLLILWSLGRLVNERDREIRYASLDEPLADLLERFGPPRATVHPEYPFWWLQTDRIWHVHEADELTAGKGANPSKGELISRDARGGFTAGVLEVLEESPDLVDEIAHRLLAAHFPESLHADILEAVELASARSAATRRKRDPRFRQFVIEAYEHRCAICGFDARLRDRLLAVEAAHIKWVQAGGPDEVANGLALCSLHHKALDMGAIGLADDLTLVASTSLHGQHGVEEWFLSFQGKPIRRPQPAFADPDPAFLGWHRREVFRGRVRDASDYPAAERSP